MNELINQSMNESLYHCYSNKQLVRLPDERCTKVPH
jgi:hypothetical protein